MILAIGPFVGSFEQEIVTFRPYSLWLRERLEYEGIYLCTHFNRKFLYDFISDKHFVSVNKYLTRDEPGQEGYTHNLLTAKEFNHLVKFFKGEIAEREKCSKRDINLKSLSYTKTMTPYSIYNKVFRYIDVDRIDILKDYENKYVFIPTEKSDAVLDVHDYLNHSKKEYIVVGDMNTYLLNENVILRHHPDHFENGWKYMVNIVSSAKAVICPLSYWTLICNMQKIPVFSWGKGLGQYREGGIYHLNNNMSVVVPDDNDIIDVLDSFLSRFNGVLN